MRRPPSLHPTSVRADLRPMQPHAPRFAFAALTALAAGLAGCSGVVVEGDSTRGEGGAGGSTSTSASGACAEGAWGKSFPDPYSFEYGQSVAVDSDCNVIVAGSFGGVMSFGGATISGADEDVFVAKLDPEGHHLWSKSLGIEPFQGSAVTAATPSGDVVLAGTFHGSIDFGTGAFNAPEQGIYLARLDASGKPKWARAFNGTSPAIASHVAVSPAGDIFLAGSFSGSLDLGTGPKGVVNEDSAFVACFASDGETRWADAFNGNAVTSVAVAVDSNGFSAVTGGFQGKLQVGPAFLSGAGARTGWVARLDPSGTVNDATTMDGSGAIEGRGVTLDAEGNVLVAGVFGGALDLGDGPEQAKTDRDGFLVSLGPGGEKRWGKTFGGTAPLDVTEIASDRAGGAWLTGAFGGSLDVGTGTLISSGPTDGLVAAIDGAGNFVFAKQLGGESGGGDVAMSVAVDPEGGALVTGTFMGTADLGSGPVGSAGGLDAFVSRLVK